MKLDVKSFALTCGIVWGVSLFVITWWLIAVDQCVGEKIFLGHFYIGYSVSPMGSVVGLFWAFVDGVIGGGIFAWVYNLLCGKFKS